MIVRAVANGLLMISSAIRRMFRMTARTHVRVDVDEQTHKIVLTAITREHILNLRGKYKGKGLLKALIAEKRCSKNIELGVDSILK